jgi:hypothetical protein
LSPTTNVLLAAQALYRSALGGMHHTESPTTWSAARRKVDRRSAASRAVPIVVAVDGTTEMRIRAKKKWFLQPGSEERKKLPPVHLEQRLLNKHDLSASTAPTPSLLKCVLRYAK